MNPLGNDRLISTSCVVFAITTIALVASGCDSQDLDAAIAAAESATTTSSSSGASSITTDCAYTLNVVYDLGLNPTQSFSSYSVPVTETVEASTCSEFVLGDQLSVTADLVSGNGSTLSVDQPDLGALTLKLSNSTLTMAQSSTCVGANLITQSLTYGTVNATADTFTLELQYNVKAGACQGAQGSNNGGGNSGSAPQGMGPQGCGGPGGGGGNSGSGNGGNGSGN